MKQFKPKKYIMADPEHYGWMISIWLQGRLETRDVANHRKEWRSNEGNKGNFYFNTFNKLNHKVLYTGKRETN